jgi:hypothetical protein
MLFELDHRLMGLYHRKGSLLYTPRARSAYIVVTTLAVVMQQSYAHPQFALPLMSTGMMIKCSI